VPRRHLIAIFAALAMTAAAGVLATSAAAAPCVDGCGGGGGGGGISRTFTHTLTVSSPSQGTVTSSPAGISCPATCSHDESHSVTCDTVADCPTDADMPWETYTLTASNGPSGYSPSWSGCDSVSAGQCSVKLDVNTTVTLSWMDTTNPSVTLGITRVDGKVGPTPAVSATATDNAGVARVDWFAGPTAVTPVLTDTTAPYGGVIDLSGIADGTSTFVSVRATDINGRQSATVTVSVVVDKHVAVTAGALPAFTNAATVPLTIGTDSDATMTCALNGGAAAPCASSYSPLTADSPDGTYAYDVTATDNVGNVATTSRSFTLDRTPPAVAITDAPALKYTATDANLNAVTCTLDGAAYPCSDASAPSGLAGGVHTFTVTATDKAGNSTSSTRDFTVDAAVPTTPTTPATTPAPLPAIGARLSFSVRHSGGRTLIRTLKLTHVPRGAAIAVTCKGSGCPHRAARYTAKRAGTVSLKALVGRRLGSGAKLTITLTLAGHARQRFTETMRKAGKPLSRASRAPTGT